MRKNQYNDQCKAYLHRLAVGCIVFGMLVAAISCATMQKKNRRFSNFLDEEAAPASPTARMVLLPVAIPVGLVALGADAALIHPLVMLPQCVGETYELIWANPEGSMVRQSFLLIPKVIATPAYFGVSWAWSSVFMGNICE